MRLTTLVGLSSLIMIMFVVASHSSLPVFSQGSSETCPEGNGWTKIDSSDMSLYPVSGATQYCFKAGSSNSQGCTGGLFYSWPLPEGACGLSHWSYYIAGGSPTPTSTPIPSSSPSPTATPTPTSGQEPSNTPTPTVTATPTGGAPSNTPTPSATPNPEHTPTPVVTAPPTNTPVPTVTQVPGPGRQSSLSYDVSCDKDEVKANMLLTDDGQAVSEVEVRFDYNGTKKTAKTGDTGRAVVMFGKDGENWLSAEADGFETRRYQVKFPECPASEAGVGGAVLGASTQGQVLGASTDPSTFADTGLVTDFAAIMAGIFGVVALAKSRVIG